MGDPALEMIAQIRTCVEERFRSLTAARAEEARKNVARARLREIEKVVHQLEALNFSLPEDVSSSEMGTVTWSRPL